MYEMCTFLSIKDPLSEVEMDESRDKWGVINQARTVCLCRFKHISLFYKKTL
jgi:hypothetical protein